MTSRAKITLVRAARELIGWNQHVLAEKAHLHVITVRRYERGEGVQEESSEAILGALSAAGIVFLGPDSDVIGISEGVALKTHGPRIKADKTPSEPKRGKSPTVSRDDGAAAPRKHSRSGG